MKNTPLTTLVLLTAGCLTAHAASPFNDGFAKTDLASYLTNTGVLMQDAVFAKVPGMTGDQVLRLTYDNEEFAKCKSVPVLPGHSYCLTFRARWDHDETVETNPFFEYAWRKGADWYVDLFPVYMVSFSDADHKEIKGHGTSIKGVMISGEWADYLCVFTPHGDAAFMDLAIKSGRNLGALYVDSIELGKLSGERPEDLALDFSGLDTNAHGFLYGGNIDSWRRVLPDGSAVLVSPEFVLPLGPGTYEVDLDATKNNQGHHCVRVTFSERGKRTGQKVFGSDRENPIVLAVPEGTTSVRFGFGATDLRKIKVTKRESPENE